MLGRKLFVSATDAAGTFTGRGMVSLGRALEVLAEFVAVREQGRAVFMVLSDHDGRIELRHGRDDLTASVTARAARAAMLGGLLPAREAVVWHIDSLSPEEAERIVTALYSLSGAAFRAQIAQEMAR